MGLSGRKVKQRIPNDPRNLSWADDAARFGSNYLSKFGWDSSKGLGAGGDGMKSHIKVSHKLDMLGIGANQAKDPNGIAWKQNRDFENLLRRLNENIAAEQQSTGEDEDDQESEQSEDGDGAKDEKKKKRKHSKSEEDDSEHIKKKKKNGDATVDESSRQTESLIAKSVEVVEEVTVEIQKKPIIPRHRAHRARAIAAKNISSKSAAHISEILGIAPTFSPIVEEVSQGKLTSVMDTDALGVDKITTSTKSVADYFKDKLLARTPQVNDSASPSSSNSIKDEDIAYEAPRMGLGASRYQMEVHSEVKVEEATQRMGLSKFSSLMSSSFLTSASSFLSFAAPKVQSDDNMGHISEVDSEPVQEKKKEKKKSKKRSKDAIEQEQHVVQQDDKKRKRKDKKGKTKETLTNEVADTDSDRDARKKQSKKAKDLDALEDSDAPKVEGDDIEPQSTKKHRKSKKAKLDEDGKKSRKDKQSHQTSSEES